MRLFRLVVARHQTVDGEVIRSIDGCVGSSGDLGAVGGV
jgi:hypothetical protein